MKIKLLVIFLILTIKLFSQQVSVGLKDNQYAHIKYIFKFDMFADVEQSIFITPVANQYIRGSLGYTKDFNWIKGYISAYYGMAYNNSFQNYGLKIFIEKNIGKSFGMDFLLNPHQDFDIKYNTCYGISVHYFIFKEVALDLAVTNVPEYRESINRIKPGLLFKSGNIEVKPQISIPLEGNIKNIRVLCGFDYKF
jgi:hypothetical protein